MDYVGTPCLGRRKDYFSFWKKKNVSYQVSIERLSQDDDFGARMDCMGRPGLGRGLGIIFLLAFSVY